VHTTCFASLTNFSRAFEDALAKSFGEIDTPDDALRLLWFCRLSRASLYCLRTR
jgi:hypothetical protein